MHELSKGSICFDRLSGWSKRKRKELLDWLSLQRSFLAAKTVHIFVFIAVNVVVGSLGVWMPLMTSLFVENTTFVGELSRTLSASGAYTFAVAYLAASSAYIAYDYLEDRSTIHRKSKTVFLTTAFILIILSTILNIVFYKHRITIKHL